MYERDRTFGIDNPPFAGPTSRGRRQTGAPRGPRRVGIVGRGRLGTALAEALRAVGYEVDGPAGRGSAPRGDAVILCVPDAEIPVAAEAVGGAALVGHTSGATPLTAMAPAARRGAELFGLHPLQSFAGGPAPLAGCAAAVAGSSRHALGVARDLALHLGMGPFEIADEDRAAYHAAASVASNFLVTLEDVAERVAAGAGMAPGEARARLAPLVRQTVESWAARGPEDALTGPVARGDLATVAAQRAAVAAVDEDLVAMFDALVEGTEALAARGPEPALARSGAAA